MNSFRLHTDSIVAVMKRLGLNSLTVAVLMDLQDCEFLRTTLISHILTVSLLYRVPQLPQIHGSTDAQDSLRVDSDDQDPPHRTKTRRKGILAVSGNQPLVCRVVSPTRVLGRVHPFAPYWRLETYR